MKPVRKFIMIEELYKNASLAERIAYAKIKVAHSEYLLAKERRQNLDNDFLNCRLDTIDFGKANVRAHYLFKSQKWDGKLMKYVDDPLVTVRDLLLFSKHELIIRTPNVGSRTIEAIEAVLVEHGLELAQ